MNRSIMLVGVGIILAGLALVASPIVLYGSEMFTIEQEAGIFLAPVGLLVLMIGAVQANPDRTTVGGTFGNPDVRPDRTGEVGAAAAARPVPRGFSPHAAVDCRYCGSVITYDLAFCPRCARPRACRGCGRPLEMAGELTDCPRCHRVEAFCNCPRVARASTTVTTGSVRPRRS